MRMEVLPAVSVLLKTQDQSSLVITRVGLDSNQTKNKCMKVIILNDMNLFLSLQLYKHLQENKSNIDTQLLERNVGVKKYCYKFLKAPSHPALSMIDEPFEYLHRIIFLTSSV